MSNEKLLPCPCCRSTDLLGGERAWDDCVYCRTCGLRAITPDAWNTRVIPTEPSAEMVEAVAWAMFLDDTCRHIAGRRDPESYDFEQVEDYWLACATAACRAVLAQLREAKP